MARQKGVAWGVGLLAVIVLVVAFVGKTALAQVTAGTVISNQAVATYKDGSDEVRRATSNVVYMTVQQVAGFTIVPPAGENRSVEVVAGQWVTYPFSLTNTGNGADYFWIRPYTGEANDISPVEGSYELYVDVNGDGVVDAGDVLFNSNPPVEAPGEGDDYPRPGEPKYGPLAPGATVNLLARLQVPNNAADGNEMEIHLEAVSEVGYPDVFANSGVVNFQVVSDGVMSATMQAVSNYSEDTTKVRGDGSGEITYTVTLVNEGNTTLSGTTVTMYIPENTTFKPGSLIVNGAAQSDPNISENEFNRNASPFHAGTSWTFTYTVVVHDALPGGTVITNKATIDPKRGKDIIETNQVHTTVLHQAGLVLEEADSNAATYDVNPTDAGTTYSFPYRVKNTGNASDIVSVNATIANGWAVELYQGDGLTPLAKTGNAYTLGALVPGGSTTFIVRVTVPVNAPTDSEANHVVTVTARSTNESSEVQTLEAYLKNVKGAGVQVSVVGSATQEGNPGDVLEYTLQVDNEGPTQDVFGISVDTDATPVPQGYSVQFFNVQGQPINSLTVPGNGSDQIKVRVTIPANAEPTSAPIALTVTVTSQNNPAVFAEASVQWTVAEMTVISIAPHRTGTVSRGGHTTYSFTVHNSGNTPQDVVLSTALAGSGDKKLNYAFVDDDNTVIGDTQSVLLSPDSSAMVRLRVHAPTELVLGTRETVHVKATVNENDVDWVSVTTTVAGGELNLTVDIDNDRPDPNDVVTYTITAENRSAVNLSDVEIFEKIPAYTVFEDAHGPAGVDILYSTVGGGENPDNWTTTRPNREDITDVKWVVGSLPSDPADEEAETNSVTVYLKVRVK